MRHPLQHARDDRPFVDDQPENLLGSQVHDEVDVDGVRGALVVRDRACAIGVQSPLTCELGVRDHSLTTNVDGCRTAPITAGVASRDTENKEYYSR